MSIKSELPRASEAPRAGNDMCQPMESSCSSVQEAHEAYNEIH